MNNKKIKILNNFIGIENIISVCFCNDTESKTKNFQDTICTAIARVFFNQETIIFNEKHQQLCPGANYFFKLSKVSMNETVKNYVKDEHVFYNEKNCRNYLKHLPEFPKELRNKSIVIKPFNFKNKSQIVLMLVTPAQAGRILGLLNYDKYKNIIINPCQPTCISLFAPLATKKAYINFIDYYDRYYQGKINKKNIWSEEKLIISLKYVDFVTILKNFDKSPHGSYKPNISAQKVDKIKST